LFFFPPPLAGFGQCYDGFGMTGVENGAEAGEEAKKAKIQAKDGDAAATAATAPGNHPLQPLY
jgi:hypothetical protein